MVAGILRLEQLVPVHDETVSSKMFCPEANEGTHIEPTMAHAVTKSLVLIAISSSSLFPCRL